jgi:hypothetical protein
MCAGKGGGGEVAGRGGRLMSLASQGLMSLMSTTRSSARAVDFELKKEGRGRRDGR